jgi:NAD(P)-dependent dehydrogenase (short-subunit alcohol dehydrogenase family)
MAGYLEGKVAVVTGAGRGIARGIALLMAQEGAKVVVNDYGVNVDGTEPRSEVAEQVVEEIRAAGGVAVASPHDVASWEGSRQIIETAIRNFGRIDILCNVAGILRDRMVFNMTEEEWDAVIAVHLKGNIFCSRHAAPYMVRQRWGRILNFSSGSGYGSSGQANYSAAKEGIAGFTYALARELGPYGVTCNVINPGGATRMTATVPQQAREIRAARGIIGGGGQRPAAGAAPAPQPPRPESAEGTPNDPANNAPIIVWLCTEAASNVNGQRIGSAGWQVPFTENRRVIRSISKFGRWSVEELERLVPSALMQGIPNPAPPAQPEQPAQQAPAAS